MPRSAVPRDARKPLRNVLRSYRKSATPSDTPCLLANGVRWTLAAGYRATKATDSSSGGNRGVACPQCSQQYDPVQPQLQHSSVTMPPWPQQWQPPMARCAGCYSAGGRVPKLWVTCAHRVVWERCCAADKSMVSCTSSSRCQRSRCPGFLKQLAEQLIDQPTPHATSTSSCQQAREYSQIATVLSTDVAHPAGRCL